MDVLDRLEQDLHLEVLLIEALHHEAERLAEEEEGPSPGVHRTRQSGSWYA